MKTGFYSDERTFWHSVGNMAFFFGVKDWVQPPNGSGGADTPDSKRRFLSLVQRSGLADKLVMTSAPPATVDDLRRVHTKRYIDEFKKVSAIGSGELGHLAPFSQGAFEIAQVSAGLAKGLMSDIVAGKLTNGYSLCRPAGHHCQADEAMGFCLLANIPIAIEAARKNHGIDKVAIVDWDVHQGNGTQAIYYDRGDTLAISLHQDRCFPPGYSGEDERGEGKGKGANINIPMPIGGGDAIYEYAWKTIVRPALADFKPDLIVIASGLDANCVDPLGRMTITSEGFRTLAELARADAEALCGGRLALVHEGGYNEVYVPFCGHAIMEAISGHTTDVFDPELEFFIGWQSSERTHKYHKMLIDELAEFFGYT